MRLQGSPVLVSIAMARRHIDENQNIIEFERVECIFEQHVEGLRPEVDEDVDDEHDVHDEVHHVERRTVATALHRRRLLLHKTGVGFGEQCTFIFRAFSRRFYPKRITITTFFRRKRNNNITLSAQ